MKLDFDVPEKKVENSYKKPDPRFNKYRTCYHYIAMKCSKEKPEKKVYKKYVNPKPYQRIYPDLDKNPPFLIKNPDKIEDNYIKIVRISLE